MTFISYPLYKISIRNEWKDGHMSGPFDGLRKQALMRRADSTDPTGQYLSPFRDKMAEELTVFKIDICNFFRAKFADPLAPNTEPFWTWHINWPFYRNEPEVNNPVPVNFLQIYFHWGCLIDLV
jgi:hypothetical protein